MGQRLHCHIPTYEELSYREKLLSQTETMDYNRGYENGGPGYDSSTGCIAFPRSLWENWYAYWIGQEPVRWYAYLARNEDGVFIGEVNVHQEAQTGRFEMGIVLEGKYRGQGYAVEGLNLLLRQAFEKMGAEAVYNTFETDRLAALKAHFAAGFTSCGEEDGMTELRITKEQYKVKK